MIIGTYMLQIDIKVADSDFPHKEAAKRTVPLVIAKESLKCPEDGVSEIIAHRIVKALAEAFIEMENK